MSSIQTQNCEIPEEEGVGEEEGETNQDRDTS
jgi:hypothetical protein